MGVRVKGSENLTYLLNLLSEIFLKNFLKKFFRNFSEIPSIKAQNELGLEKPVSFWWVPWQFFGQKLPASLAVYTFYFQNFLKNGWEKVSRVVFTFWSKNGLSQSHVTFFRVFTR